MVTSSGLFRSRKETDLAAAMLRRMAVIVRRMASPDGSLAGPVLPVPCLTNLTELTTLITRTLRKYLHFLTNQEGLTLLT